MTSDEACTQFVNGRIARDLQPFYPQFVAAYRMAWSAGVAWARANSESRETKATVERLVEVAEEINL